jgi:circadian clock protein KaiB
MTSPVPIEPANGANGDGGAEGQEQWRLRLYVAGKTPESARALANLRRLGDEHLESRYEIEVIDLLENPRLAAGDEIIAIPTVVRMLPTPIRRIIGDMTDDDQVLVGLQLRPGPQ